MHFAVNVFIWNLKDVFGIGLFLLVVLTFVVWYAYAAFIDWKNSSKRWWNKK